MYIQKTKYPNHPLSSINIRQAVGGGGDLVLFLSVIFGLVCLNLK